MTWIPVLHKEEAAGLRTSEALGFIKDRLLAEADHIPSQSLYMGRSGVALFLFYYASFTQDTALLAQSQQLVVDIFSRLFDSRPETSLCNGLAGVGWMLEHLQQQGFIDADTNEVLDELDEIIIAAATDDVAEGRYDFMHHSAGMCLYLLTRLNAKPSLASSINAIISGWDNKAIKTPDGQTAKWIDTFNQSYGEAFEGVINLGVAHGIPGIIGTLRAAHAKGIRHPASMALANAAVNFMLSQQLDHQHFNCTFPSMLKKNEVPGNSNLAWCYGDLGAGITLLLHAQDTGNTSLAQKVNDILQYSVQRLHEYDHLEYQNTGFCHGTTGIAHLYNRAFHYTGENIFREAALHWYQLSTNALLHTDFDTSWNILNKKLSGTTTDYRKFSMLEGLAGAGLCLLGAIDNRPPDWDAAMLLS